MKCFNCSTTEAHCYYSPKELTKYNILFCPECIKLLKNIDLRYIDTSNNKEYANKELKLVFRKR